MTNAILLNRLRGQLRRVVEEILMLEGEPDTEPFFDGQLLELRVERQWLSDLLEDIERYGLTP